MKNAFKSIGRAFARMFHRARPTQKQKEQKSNRVVERRSSVFEDAGIVQTHVGYKHKGRCVGAFGNPYGAGFNAKGERIKRRPDDMINVSSQQLERIRNS